MNMRIKILAATLLAAFGLTSVTTAQATTISIGLQQAGVNSGNISTVNTGSISAGVTGLSYGTFNVNSVNAQADGGVVFPDLMFSNAINTSTSTPGTLTVWVTAQGLTQPTGTHTLISSFTANTVPSGWTIEEKTFYDALDGLYSTATPLGSATFTSSLQTAMQNDNIDFSNSFSITHEYIITAIGSGSSNNTIDTRVAVPEPGTLGIFGLGLLALGLTLRYKRSKG